MLYGTTARNSPSRFVREIPEHVLDDRTVPDIPKAYGWSGGYDHGFGKPKTAAKYAKSVAIGGEKQSSSSAYRFGQAGNTAEKPTADFNVGDTVRHKSFGTGVILSLKPMGNDVLMEIAFDKAGTKKVMANFARLEKI